MIRIRILTIIGILGFLGSKAQETGTPTNSSSKTSGTANFEASENYLKDRDLDGDGLNDHIGFDYTGGAHCCYKMTLKLSSMNDTIEYPFEMDGGYVFGMVDGSQPDQFEIDDHDRDGLPEIFMAISMYNGEKNPIDPKWTREFGIGSNYIIFDYKEGRMVVEDHDKEEHGKRSQKH